MPAFSALADPTRRRVLDLLVDGPLDAGTIAGNFETSRPAISRHLRVLREAGLVSAEREAQRMIYELRPEGLAEIDRWLARYRAFWAEKLDRLENHLEDTK